MCLLHRDRPVQTRRGNGSKDGRPVKQEKAGSVEAQSNHPEHRANIGSASTSKTDRFSRVQVLCKLDFSSNAIFD